MSLKLFGDRGVELSRGNYGVARHAVTVHQICEVY